MSVSDDGNSNSMKEEFEDLGDTLQDHRFGLSFKKTGQYASVRRWVNNVLLVSAFLIAVFVIWGCVWTSFSLEVLGILGIAVESGQEFQQAVTDHSLFTMVQAVMNQAQYLDIGKYYLGLGVLSSLLAITVFFVSTHSFHLRLPLCAIYVRSPDIFFFTLLTSPPKVPLFQTASLLWLWFRHMSKSTRKQLKTTIEILQAWQYIEVYILSVIVAAWQIGDVSGFMVNDFCGGLENTLASMAYYGIISKEDAQCFRVEARLEGATYVLLVSALILGLLNHFIMKAAEHLENDVDMTKRPIDKNEMDKGDLSAEASKVHPVPPRFTDFYWWLVSLEEIPADDNGGYISDDPDKKFIEDISETPLGITSRTLYNQESSFDATADPSFDNNSSVFSHNRSYEEEYPPPVHVCV